MPNIFRNFSTPGCVRLPKTDNPSHQNCHQKNGTDGRRAFWAVIKKPIARAGSRISLASQAVSMTA